MNKFQGCEMIDVARLNELFIEAQKVLREEYKQCVSKHNAVIRTEFINGKCGRTAKYVCSHPECGETLIKDTTHKVATINGKKYNTMNIRSAKATAESRFRNRRLRTIQVI